MIISRLVIVHQIDPVGGITGGIDAYILSIIKNTPAHIEIVVIGATTSAEERPVGGIRPVQVGGRTVLFLPVATQLPPMRRSWIPNTVRVGWGLIRYRNSVMSLARTAHIDFHRMEYAFLVRCGARRRLFFHQDMQVLFRQDADIMWKKAPKVYFGLEMLALRSVREVVSVSKSGLSNLRSRAPRNVERIRFLPTWADETVFHPVSDYKRNIDLVTPWLRLPEGRSLITSVGRLDSQKNPLRALRVMKELLASENRFHLLWIGTGPLHGEFLRFAHELGIADQITVAGHRSPGEIAAALNFSSLYLSTSTYEGMPISVIEALCCGVPVVGPRVGEIPSLLNDRICGALYDEAAADAEIAEMIKNLSSLNRDKIAADAIDASKPYLSGTVVPALFSDQ